MNKKLVTTIFSTSSILLLFLLWQIYSIQVDNPTLMPSVGQVFESLSAILSDGETYHILFTSLGRLLLSLIMASVLGISLGLLSGMSSNVEAFLKPIIVTIRTLPVISIIVIVLIIFGNTTTLYIISLLLLVPLIYQAVLDGIKNIDPLLIDVVKLDSNHTNVDVLKNVYFPLSIPFLRSAMIDAIGLGFKVLIIAEYIAQTTTSIGRKIYIHKINLEFSSVFAWTLLILGMVLLIEYVVEQLLRPRVD